MESNYLAWLNQELAKNTSSAIVPLGIGDDAAIIGTERQTVCCTDLLAQGTHFLIESAADLARVGRKALAVNLSDMAAMGAEPQTAMLSLLVNRENGLQQAKEVTRGLLELASEFGVVLVGGDTCSWDGNLVVNVSVTGRLLQSQPLLRSTAQPGDGIFVTGPLGGSILAKHWSFTPRCREIASLLQRYRINAATDISDGLVRDLNNILEASHVGATLWSEAIPISDAARELANSETMTQSSAVPYGWAGSGLSRCWYHALYDGEDFELLLTIPPNQLDALAGIVNCEVDGPIVPLIQVGQIDQELGLRLRHQDQILPIPAGGYCH